MWQWRGMFDLIPLPPAWPVYVSQAEASAHRTVARRAPADRSGVSTRRLRRAGRDRADAYPWGDAAPSSAHGVFDFASWDPEPAGSHPAGRSAWGVDDLVGNGWEWTSTPFAPFAGFRPMASYPEYSADFFDGEHFVMKGASPATARELIRPPFRNWFRARYPYSLRDVPLREGRAMSVRSASSALAQAEAAKEFAADVQYYLTLQPRQLPSRYLYDGLGSALFDAICRLP